MEAGNHEYTFHYFAFYVRGEPIRMMLTHAGVNFKDHAVTFEEWMGPFSPKPTMPGGQMPCLELKDGTKMGEGYSISRYLGSVHGYYPSDPREAFEVDQLLDGYEDCLSKIYKP